MRRLALPVLAAALLLGAAPSAPADDFSGALTALHDSLQARSELLSGTVDPVEKKQLKSLLSALKALDKPANDLGDDVKAAGKAAKILGKAFPGEFEASAGVVAVADLTLGQHCNAAFLALQGFVANDLDDLDGAVPTLSDKGKAKLQAGLDKAAAALAAVVPGDFAGWAKYLAQAYKETVKGYKVVGTDPGPDQNVSITVDGAAFKPSKDTVVAVLDEVTGVLVFSASRAGLPAYSMTVTPATSALTLGSKGVSVGTWTVAALPPKSYLATSGNFEITALDTTANLVSFTFSFTAPGQLGAPGSVTINGSYSGPYLGD